MFDRVGFGTPLFQPIFVGSAWMLQAEKVESGAIQAYATRVSGQTYHVDPVTREATPGIPSHIKRQLLQAVKKAALSRR